MAVRRRASDQLHRDPYPLPQAAETTGAKKATKGPGKVAKKSSRKRLHSKAPRRTKSTLHMHTHTTEEASADDPVRCTRKCLYKEVVFEGLWVCCEKCKNWQHGPCMSLWVIERVPKLYLCDRCRPGHEIDCVCGTKILRNPVTGIPITDGRFAKCIVCDVWQHAVCVGVTKSQLINYYCADCRVVKCPCQRRMPRVSSGGGKLDWVRCAECTNWQHRECVNEPPPVEGEGEEGRVGYCCPECVQRQHRRARVFKCV